MNKTRRIGTMVAATLAATGVAMTVASAPATARPRPHNDGPTAITRYLGSVEEGDRERVRVWFRTDETVCDFRLVVRDNRYVDVWHSDGRHSELSRDDTLRRGERDYAMITVRPENVRRDSLSILSATMYYRDCDWRDNNGRNRDRDRVARWESKRFGLLLRIEDDDRRGSNRR